MAELLLGKTVAEAVFEMRELNGLCLAAVGFQNAQWQQYVGALERSAQKCGVVVKNVNAEGKTPLEFCNLVAEISARADVDGVILQQPLPKEFAEASKFLAATKDIDCISCESVAKLYRGEDGFQPATPLAVLRLLDFYGIDLAGKNVVIVGRGNAVGKPLALMCLKRNATVTVCHTKTQNLPSITKKADVLISACGVAGLITKEYVSPHSVVVDVGLSFVGGKTCGDVSEEVYDIVQAVSPVPGGVGPVTRAALFCNLAKAKAK